MVTEYRHSLVKNWLEIFDFPNGCLDIQALSPSFPLSLGTTCPLWFCSCTFLDRLFLQAAFRDVSITAVPPPTQVVSLWIPIRLRMTPKQTCSRPLRGMSGSDCLVPWPVRPQGVIKELKELLTKEVKGCKHVTRFLLAINPRGTSNLKSLRVGAFPLALSPMKTQHIYWLSYSLLIKWLICIIGLCLNLLRVGCSQIENGYHHLVIITLASDLGSTATGFVYLSLHINCAKRYQGSSSSPNGAPQATTGLVDAARHEVNPLLNLLYTPANGNLLLEGCRKCLHWKGGACWISSSLQPSF